MAQLNRKFIASMELKDKTCINKKKLRFAAFFCAQNKTRTCTPLRAPAPQAGVSTNFTIWADWLRAQGNGLRVSYPVLGALRTALFFVVPRTGLEPAHHC